MLTRQRPLWTPEPWTQLHLPYLGEDVEPERSWSFAMSTVEGSGRLTLPTRARDAFHPRTSLRLSSRGEIAILREGGAGRVVVLGVRSRIVLPCWLRDATDPDGQLLVATRCDPAADPLVVLAPPRLLSGFADAMAGEER